MAQIDLQRFKKINKERNITHEKVYSTYTVFENDGEKLFQIDTYGKIDRKSPEKVSQSLQLNKETARALVDILSKEFDI